MAEDVVRPSEDNVYEEVEFRPPATRETKSSERRPNSVDANVYAPVTSPSDVGSDTVSDELLQLCVEGKATLSRKNCIVKRANKKTKANASSNLNKLTDVFHPAAPSPEVALSSGVKLHVVPPAVVVGVQKKPVVDVGSHVTNFKGDGVDKFVSWSEQTESGTFQTISLKSGSRRQRGQQQHQRRKDETDEVDELTRAFERRKQKQLDSNGNSGVNSSISPTFTEGGISSGSRDQQLLTGCAALHNSALISTSKPAVPMKPSHLLVPPSAGGVSSSSIERTHSSPALTEVKSTDTNNVNKAVRISAPATRDEFGVTRSTQENDHQTSRSQLSPKRGLSRDEALEWEDVFSDDDDVYENLSSEQNDGAFSPSADDELGSTAKLTKLQHIVQELWQTEQAYVRKLQLISVDFYNGLVLANKSEPMISDSDLTVIFSNVHSILQFHQDFLLPELYQCTVGGGETKSVGNVMKTKAPFFKLYVEYVNKFNAATDLIDQLKKRSTKFSNFVENFQRLPACGMLTIKNHMLEPVQRIPRYELLLKDYLRNLPDDSTDRADAQEALVLVSAAATKSNEVIRGMDKFNKLLEISRNLSGCPNDFVVPGRSFVKEGRINVIAKKNREVRDRHFILMNDILLICRPIPLSIKTQYKILAQLDVYGMRLLDCADDYSLWLHSKQKLCQLRFSSPEEREDWQNVLNSTISEQTRSVDTRQLHDVSQERTFAELDNWSPVWRREEACVVCGLDLTQGQRTVHICRACGAVVCGDCGSRKMALSFCGMREKRVCDNCYYIICRQRSGEPSPTQTRFRNQPLTLQRPNETPPAVSGHLLTSRDQIKWEKRWFTLHSNSVLFSFYTDVEISQETVPSSALLLSEYQLKLTMDTSRRPSESTTADKSNEFFTSQAFVLVLNKRKELYFRARDHADVVRWVAALQPHAKNETVNPRVSTSATAAAAAAASANRAVSMSQSAISHLPSLKSALLATATPVGLSTAFAPDSAC